MAVDFEKKVAILIGVNTYEHVTSLYYCRNDVVEFGTLLRGTLGFKDDDVLEMIEDTKYPPTRGAIFHCLGEMKKDKKVSTDDLLLFFFSGHGMTDEEGKDYLLPADATPYNLEKTAIAVEDITKELKKTDCNNVVMFIDACRNLGQKAAGDTSIGIEAAEAVRRAGIVTFFSCDPKHKSYEIDALKHGSFTHCLIEAIRKGEATTVSSLDAYLRKRVPEVNREHKKDTQEPYAVIEPAEKGKLPVFFSAVQQGAAIATIEDWKNFLTNLYTEEQITLELLDKTLEYLNGARETSTFDQDQKTILIKRICEKNIKLDTFIRAWGALEKKTPKPKVKTSLGNL